MNPLAAICGSVLFLFGGASVCRSATESAPLVALISVQQGEVAPPAPLHLFGGKETGLMIALESRLKSGEATLIARFYPETSGMTVPMELPLSDGKWAPEEQGVKKMRVRLMLPEVSATMGGIARFFVQQGEQRHHAGDVRLRVYPTDPAAPLEAFSEGIVRLTGKPIAVFGLRRELREFLREHKIPFDDLGEQLPSSVTKGRVYCGDASPERVAAWKNRQSGTTPARLIIFTEDDETMAGVYTSREGALHFTKVTLPVLDQLNDHPLHQTTVVKLLISL